MVLNNYRSLMVGKSSNASVFFKDESGTEKNVAYSQFGALSVNSKIVVGDSDVETPTQEDVTNYKLDNDITSQFTITTATTGTVIHDGNTDRLSIGCKYKNETGADIIIKEYGLEYPGQTCLLTRKVLDDPITVHDGEYLVVSLVIG